MFYVPGWISLKEVVLSVRRFYREWEIPEFSEVTDVAGEDHFRYHLTRANRLIWHKLKEWANNDQVGVLLPGGFVALASESLVAGGDDGGDVGFCVDLLNCTVGSATWEVEKYDYNGVPYGDFEALEDKQKRYGAYLFCPVVIDENAVGPLFATLQGDHQEKRQPLTAKEIVEAVVDAYRRGGQRPTRRFVMETYMPNDKHAAFEAVWREITGICPELSKGGRPAASVQRS